MGACPRAWGGPWSPPRWKGQGQAARDPPAAAAGDRPLALTQLQLKVLQPGLTFARRESRQESPGDICSVTDVPLHRDGAAQGTRGSSPCCTVLGFSFARFLHAPWEGQPGPEHPEQQRSASTFWPGDAEQGLNRAPNKHPFKMEKKVSDCEETILTMNNFLL